MITVGMNYHVIEGKQSDFEEKFAAVISALNAADGHESSTLVRLTQRNCTAGNKPFWISTLIKP